MALDNHEIARVLNEIADLLEIAGENFFRVRAYRNAGLAVADHPAPLAPLDRKQLAEIPGIGVDLAGKIRTLIEGGQIDTHQALLKKVPAGLLELRHIRGLGPKRIKTLFDVLKIKGRDDLRKAVEAGALGGLPGFGPKMEAQIREALAKPAVTASPRMLWSEAAGIVEALVKHLRKCKAVELIEPAGSFRRHRDTVGDLDVVVASSEAAAVMAQLRSFPQVRETLGAGDTRATVMLSGGLQMDLRVVPRESFGAAFLYFTGSKGHCVRLRRMAQLKDLMLNEYGLFRGDTPIAGADEEGIYRALGLSWIPPELREDRGELDASLEGRLPHLLERNQLRGDLHTHSTWTDGRASIEEMARAAKKAGLEYFAVTDHSRRLAMARGLDPARLRDQWREIDKVAQKVQGIRLLRGIEVDIMDDGTLDLPDDVLSQLDWVVASVHYKFEQSPREMTARIVKAIRNPNVSVLGHPSGRLLNRREGYQFDLDEVLRAARGEGCALEVNSQARRLDLNDVACLTAKHAGVKVVVSSDSHHPKHFAALQNGVDQARRGWLEASDVLNTLPVEQLLSR